MANCRKQKSAAVISEEVRRAWDECDRSLGRLDQIRLICLSPSGMLAAHPYSRLTHWLDTETTLLLMQVDSDPRGP